MWNKYGQAGARTNNSLEGYNSKLKKLIGSNPHLWKFIKILKDEETSEEFRQFRNAAGVKDRRRNERDMKRDLEITHNNLLYASGEIDIWELLSVQAGLVIEY